MRRTNGPRAMRWVEVAAAAALAAGALGAVPAQAALDPTVLEAVDAPEVAEVAIGVAALLDSVGGDAEEQEIAAALHRYLADSEYDDLVLEDALAVVLAGDWSETQRAALNSIFAEYAPQDLAAPGGGIEAPAATTLSRAAETPAVDESTDEKPETNSEAHLQGFGAPPPPPAGGGGSSDYDR